MSDVTIELNPKQYEAIECGKKETFFIGGLGSGKSFTLAMYAYSNIHIPGSIGFIGAPTFNTLKNSTLKQIQEAWLILGLEPNIHYVVNKLPPKKWGVEPFSILDQSKVITFCWGSYVLVDGLDNFNTIRGTEFDWMAIDEFRDLKEGARDVILGRLRGRLFKNTHRTHRVMYATTPPDNPIFLQKLSESQDSNLQFVFSSSLENKANLPEGYIETMLARYDTITAQREVYGELVLITQNQFAYAFNEAKHIKRSIPILHEDLPIWLSFDFNVDPMTCIIAQSDGINFLQVLTEIRVPNGDVYKACELITDWFNEHLVYENKYAVYITGDASGNARHAYSKMGLTGYDIICQELHINPSAVKTPSINPAIVDSRILLNSILQNMYDVRFYVINCPYLVDDLRYVEIEHASDGKVGIKKSGKTKAGKDTAHLTHLLDCFRYFIQATCKQFIQFKR